MIGLSATDCGQTVAQVLSSLSVNSRRFLYRPLELFSSGATQWPGPDSRLKGMGINILSLSLNMYFLRK